MSAVKRRSPLSETDQRRRERTGRRGLQRCDAIDDPCAQNESSFSEASDPVSRSNAEAISGASSSASTARDARAAASRARAEPRKRSAGRDD